MSSAATHRLVGVSAGIATAFLDQNPEDERLALGTILVASCLMGSKFPDVLEPAIHTHHRQFFHSLIVLVGVAGAAMWLWRWRPQTLELRCLRASLCGFFIGYGSHLSMDSLTPRSIPVL